MKIVTASENRLVMRLAFVAVLLSFAMVIFGILPGAQAYATDQEPQDNAAIAAEEAQAGGSDDSANSSECDQAEEEAVADEAACSVAPEEEAVADEAANTATPEEAVADEAANTAAPEEEAVADEAANTAAPEEEAVADEPANTAAPEEEAVADEPADTAAPEEEAVADEAALSNADPTPKAAPASDADADAAPVLLEVVYIDGQRGNDNNDGTTSGNAVRTWAKATSLLADNGVIYISGTITLKNGDVISSNGPGDQVVKRATAGSEPLFKADNVSGVVFKNVVFDGEGKNGRLLEMDGGSVSFKNGAVIKNFYYSGNGGAVYCVKGKIYVDGAQFLNNTANGYGGAIYQRDGSEITVRSGRFEGNTAETGYGGAINQWSSADKAHIYNAVFTNNTAESGGAIANCESGSNVTLEIDGAAIYDNTATSNNGSDDIYTRGRENATVSDDMLGGGEHNWSHRAGSSGWASAPSIADKANAIAEAVTFFIGNLAKYDGGAIRSNGNITLGRAQAALEIKKIDSKTGEGLEGVEFTLEGNTIAGNELIKVNTSDSGTITIENISPGEYTLRETKRLDNYKKIDNVWRVVVSYTDDEQVATELKMYDSEGNEMVRDASTDYYYVIKNEPIEVKISKQILGQGEELPGATLRVTGTTSDGTEIEPIEWESGDTPKTFNLLPGEYVLTEESCPKGYLMAEDISFTVDEYGKVWVGGVEAENATVVMEDAVEEEVVSDEPSDAEVPEDNTVKAEKTGDLIDSETNISNASSVQGAYEDQEAIVTASVDGSDDSTVKTASSNGSGKAPATGDSTPFGLLAMMLLLAAATLTGIVRRRANNQ